MPEQPNPNAPEAKVNLQEAAVFTSYETDKKFAPKTEAGRKRLERWKKLRDEGAKPTNILQEISESGRRGRFTTIDGEELKSTMGGGRTEVDTTVDPPRTRIEESATPLEKISFENASQRIDEIASFINYSEILSESQRTKKEIDVIIKERIAKGDKSISGIKHYNEARNQALDMLLTEPSIIILFPDAEKLASTAEKRSYIEEMLSKDPIFRSKIESKMQEIKESAQELPDVIRDEELKTAETKQKDLQNAISIRINSLVESVAANGIEITPDEKQEIERLSKSGATPEQIINRLRSMTLDKIPHAAEFATYQDLEKQTAEAFNKWKAASENVPKQVGKNNVANPEVQTAATNLWDDYKRFEKDLIESKKTIDGNRTDYSKYLQLDKLYSLDSTDTVTGQRLSEISQLSTELQEVNAQIEEKKANPNKAEKASILARQKAEAALQSSLDSVIAESVAETVEERYNSAVLQEQKAMAEDAEKTGTADDKAVVKGISTDFIEFDPRTREKIVHSDNIEEGKRFAVYEGNDGIKRMLMRHLNFEKQRVDASGAPEFDSNGIPLMDRVDWRTVDLDSLSDEQKKRLDAVYAKHGDAYRDRLFKDMYASRTLRSKLTDALPGRDRMGLKRHEWELLEQNFSGQLTEALSKNKQAQDAIKNLETQGIKPDFKMKWLLLVLLSLGLAIPAAGAIGTLSKSLS